MKRLLPLVLAAACGAVFAQNAQNANGQLDKKDREFIEKAAAGGMMEVEVGRLAESKAQNADVKAFGSTLVKDHSAANDELKSIAQKKGVQVPSALPKKEQKELDKLSKSKDFDKDFIKHVGVSDHKKDIKDFQKEAKNGKDPDVKGFASKTLPTLQSHLQTAEGLEKSAKAKKS